MPIYDYQCEPHGHRFERRQAISDEPVKICPECGGPVRRVIHPVGIVFKGSGFYATDSRSKGGETKSTGDKETPGSEAPAAKAETGGEAATPPAKPAESKSDAPASS